MREILSRPPDALLAEIEAAGVRGRSGWTPVAAAWRKIRARAAFRPYVVANASGGGAGGVRERILLERSADDVLAGILVAARTLGAPVAFLVIRGDRRAEAERLESAVERLGGEGLLTAAGLTDLIVHRGPASYVAGEATAVLEALEGKPPFPRQKPSDPAEAGLWGLPTALHNVETFAAVARAAESGAEAFRREERVLVSVTGAVARPGVFEVPLGMFIRELIETRAGGLPPGRTLAAFFPCGPGSAPLGPDQLDLPLLPEAVEAAGSSPGPLDVIVLDDGVCPVGIALALARSAKESSCGICPPCAQGTGNLHAVLTRLERGGARPADAELLKDLVHFLHPRGQCGLPKGAAQAVGGLMRLFPGEFSEHAKGTPCAREQIGPMRPLGPLPGPGRRVCVTAEPSPELRIARYPDRRGAFIDRLWRLQDRLGWVPPAEAEDEARRCGIPTDRLRYDLPQIPGLRLRPTGGSHLKLCGGLPCVLAGIDRLTPPLKEQGVGRQTRETPAEVVTAEWAACLGMCDRAPAVMVDVG